VPPIVSASVMPNRLPVSGDSIILSLIDSVEAHTECRHGVPWRGVMERGNEEGSCQSESLRPPAAMIRFPTRFVKSETSRESPNV